MKYERELQQNSVGRDNTGKLYRIPDCNDLKDIKSRGDWRIKGPYITRQYYFQNSDENDLEELMAT